MPGTAAQNTQRQTDKHICARASYAYTQTFMQVI